MITFERNGMRLQVYDKRLVVGPLTKEGAIILSGTLYPYDQPGSKWVLKFKELFGCGNLGDFEVTMVKTLPADGTLIVAELTKIERPDLDDPDRFHPFL